MKTLTINTNIEVFEKKQTLIDRIKNRKDIKRCKKQLREKELPTSDKMFVETLIIDEILGEENE